MTLSFSTIIKGKKSRFVSKILEGLISEDLISEYQYNKSINDYLEKGYCFDFSVGQKIHTIRKDALNRWKPSKLIHFVINSRTARRLQFAPAIPCISVENIEIRKVESDCNSVIINGLKLTPMQIDVLAINDGFDSTDDFWQYFDQKDFKGKLIHWTNFSYGEQNLINKN